MKRVCVCADVVSFDLLHLVGVVSFTSAIIRYVANVGDSTGVLAKKTGNTRKAYGWEQITQLHRLSDEDERRKCGTIPHHLATATKTSKG